MNKSIKITITFFLILSLLSCILFLLIYPNYNNILLTINSYNIYNLSKETSIKILTQISPTTDNYEEKVLGYTSIEESLKDQQIVLDRKILEELNTIIRINELNIEGPILQGESSLTMDQGFWHFPISKFPGEKGNVVIIGHRFMNMPPAKDTFFNLDQTKIGERIVVAHHEGEFTYIVVDIKEVEPNDITVVQDSDDYRLTLITCTPLWTSEKRLVIVAKLDKLYKKV
jgi:LPXTG-site transpeptidase (sortase) family protein